MLKLWTSLSHVFRLCYSHSVSHSNRATYERTVQAFIEQVRLQAPEMMQKLKIHLLLHLPENLDDFGPPCNYNTERCESLNSVLRNFNVHGNRQAPSRDIATAFGTTTALHLMACASEFGVPEQSSSGSREVKIGSDFKDVMKQPVVASFLFGTQPSETSDKDIYCHGSLRKCDEKGWIVGDIFVTLPRPGLLQGYTNVANLEAKCTAGKAIYCRDVNSQHPHLVPLLSHVQYKAGNDQVLLGTLVACYAIQREVNMVVVPFIPLGTTRLDCPLYVRSQDIATVPASSLINDVSLMHNCGRECKVTGTGFRSNIYA